MVSTSTQQNELASSNNLSRSRFLIHTGIRWKREVFKLTGGKGVDVALITPSEEGLHGLGACMTGMGVCVRILRGLENVDNPPLKFRTPNITYVSINISTIARSRPERLGHCLEKVQSMISDDFAPSTNVECIAVSQIEEAFAEMRTSTAPEQIVISAEVDTKVRVR